MSRISLYFWMYVQMMYVLPPTSSLCTFPSSLIGSWVRAKDEVPFVITVDTVTGFNYHSSGYDYSNFVCEQRRGDKFLLVESKSSAYTGNIQFTYLCLNIEVLGNHSIVFTDLAEEGRSLTTAVSVVKPPLVFVKGVVDTMPDLTIVDVCSSEVVEVQPEVLYRRGIGSTAGAIGVTCPESIFGNYNYTVDGAQCPGNSSLAMCADRKSMVANYTQCGYTVAYSHGGVLDCMGDVTRGGTTWMWAYNRDVAVDNNSTYRVTCFVIQGSGDSVTLTFYPLDCPVEQNASNISSSGHTLDMSALALCPFTISPRESSKQAVIVGATVGGILFLTAMIVFSAVLCFRFMKRKQVTSPKPVNANLNTKTEEVPQGNADTVSTVTSVDESAETQATFDPSKQPQATDSRG